MLGISKVVLVTSLYYARAWFLHHDLSHVLVTLGVFTLASIASLLWTKPQGGAWLTPRLKLGSLATFGAILLAEHLAFLLLITRLSLTRVIIFSQFTNVWSFAFAKSVSTGKLQPGALLMGASLVTAVLSDLMAPKGGISFLGSGADEMVDSRGVLMGYALVLAHAALSHLRKARSLQLASQVGTHTKAHVLGVVMGTVLLFPVATIGYAMVRTAK